MEDYVEKINSLRKEMAIAEKKIKELINLEKERKKHEEAEYVKNLEAYKKLELSAKRKVKRLLKKYNYLVVEEDDTCIYVSHTDFNSYVDIFLGLPSSREALKVCEEDIFFDNHYANDWQDALYHCEEYIEWHKNIRINKE